MAFRQKTFTSWSFSRYSTYKQCPLKAKLQYLDKVAEPKNPAMQRGGDLHDQARDFIKGVLKKLPADLAPIKQQLADLKKLFKKRLLGATVEEDWSFTKDWTQTVWNDWQNCVLRIKIDAGYYLDDSTYIVKDWKTGKFRPELNEEYLEQLELYALAALILLPHIEQVLPQLVYVDQDLIYPPANKPIVYKRKDITRLKKLWAKRTKPMLNDTRFAPRPNDKCRWCFYGQSGKIKGGPGLCKF